VYQWKKNGSPAGTNSITYSSNAFVNGDQVTCTMTSNANCISGNPVTSAPVNMTVNVCNLTLNLKIFIEGFYSGGGQMQPVLYNNSQSSDPTASDSITVELYHSFAPYDLVYSKKGLIHTNGNGSFNFLSVTQGSYYIVIRHRNAIETWSKDPVLINSSPLSFDFTSP
jgi:hypothetical protein